ncbi:MAG: hypothetical protein ACI9OU_001033 [Candidatus Promineifilaceae bacterium]|jgi:hypothetical protein
MKESKYSYINTFRRLFAALSLAAVLCTQAWGQTAPIDLMDMSLEDLLKVHLIERTVQEGEDTVQRDSKWGIGYRYTVSTFGDYKDGTRDVTIEEVMQAYPVVPNKITQEAHVLELTYAHSDASSFIAVVPYISQNTDHLRRVGDPFSIRSGGVGDMRLQGLHRINKKANHNVSLSMGMSLPTGSIDERGDTPRGANSQLPYTMQVGSGTFDLLSGISYSAGSTAMSWGTQFNWTQRLGRNGRGYSLGDRYLISAWMRRACTQWVDVSLKGAFQSWDDIDGSDPDLNPTIAPVANPNIQGGTRSSIFLGAQLKLPGERFKGQTIEIELGLPVHEDLNGPQPGQDRLVSIGWRKDI